MIPMLLQKFNSHLNKLIFFALGFLFCLILLNAFLGFIDFTVKASLSEWLSTIGTLSAVIVALSIVVWGKSLKELFYKPNLKILGSLENIQNGQGQTRLILRNQGSATSEDVEAYVNQVVDGNGIPRPGFLPVPLSWTHSGWPPIRSFHPNQVGYLDLCRIDNPTATPILVLAAGIGVPVYQDIYAGNTKIELVVYQKSGQALSYELNLKWQPGESFVHLENFIQTGR